MFYPGSLYQILIEKLGVPVSAIINAAVVFDDWQVAMIINNIFYY